MARSKPKRTRRSVTYRLPEDLLDQLEILKEQTRRTVTAEIEIALEDHLKAAGLWPLPTPEKDDAPKKKS